MTTYSAGSEDSLTSFLESGRDEGVYPGAVVAIGTAEGIDCTAAVGQRDPACDESMTRSTLFDAASLTKPVVTATVALCLVERGTIALSDELGRHVPDLDGRRQGDIQLRELLTHTSGLQPYAFSESWESRAEALAGLAAQSLFVAAPGDHYEYSCLNFVYLAEALRCATDRSLADLADALIFEPADMPDSCLGPVTDTSTVATTYDHDYRDQSLRGEIHDPLGWVMDGESGNAGLFTTVDDLAAFAQAYLRRDGTLLSPAMIDRLQDNWLPEMDTQHSLGWRLAEGTFPAPNWSPRGLGHTGYTGTSLWLDHDHNRFATLLTNQVYDGKETGLIRFRERFHAMVAAGRFD